MPAHPSLIRLLLVSMALLLSAGCATRPQPIPAVEQAPLVLLPASLAGISDHRAQFRELFCAVNQELAGHDPEYMPCDEALTRLAGEPAPPAVPMGWEPGIPRVRVAVVLGLGWECLQALLEPELLPMKHLRQLGYQVTEIHVDGLSSTAQNARAIRDALLAEPEAGAGPPLLLLGYSKGAIDSLEAIATYPEVARRVAALVSISGSIGGSPLADEIAPDVLALMRLAPGAQCDAGDGGALQSLKPHVRQRWLAEHPLPRSVRYYSLATSPDEARVSAALSPMQQRLTQWDPLNDGNLLARDQLIPGSALLGYVNADHWAVALPIAASNPWLGSTLVNRNGFPRNALWEALVRYVESDLNRMPGSGH
jgi:hypothetical protein